MKTMQKAIAVPAAVMMLLLMLFLAGRYGWTLLGFQACQGAGITSVEVGENAVQITGFYPGSFPKGFCGCYAKEQAGKLYVGFRFSALFGFFEPGDFDTTIPVRGEIDEVIVRAGMREYSVWNAATGRLFRPECDGVCGEPERSGTHTVSVFCNNCGKGIGQWERMCSCGAKE